MKTVNGIRPMSFDWLELYCNDDWKACLIILDRCSCSVNESEGMGAHSVKKTN